MFSKLKWFVLKLVGFLSNERPSMVVGSGIKPRLEEVEGRLVPAFVVNPPDSYGQVQVVGSTYNDTANITVNPTSITINGTSFAASKVKSVVANGYGGDDTINLTYTSGAFNPAVTLRGGGNSDKVEIWNAAGKNVAADGGDGTNDRIALHGLPFLGRGRQTGFEVFWTDAQSQVLGQAFLGRDVSELKTSGDLPAMSPNVANNVCCANFVSATLETSGRLTADQHQNSVSGLDSKLRALGWRQVAVKDAKPGDVFFDGKYSHVELVLSNNNGAVTLIGANNYYSDGTQIHPDNSQQVTTDTGSYKHAGSYVLTPP